MPESPSHHGDAEVELSVDAAVDMVACRRSWWLCVLAEKTVLVGLMGLLLAIVGAIVKDVLWKYVSPLECRVAHAALFWVVHSGIGMAWQALLLIGGTAAVVRNRWSYPEKQLALLWSASRHLERWHQTGRNSHLRSAGSSLWHWGVNLDWRVLQVARRSPCGFWTWLEFTEPTAAAIDALWEFVCRARRYARSSPDALRAVLPDLLAWQFRVLILRSSTILPPAAARQSDRLVSRTANSISDFARHWAVQRATARPLSQKGTSDAGTLEPRIPLFSRYRFLCSCLLLSALGAALAVLGHRFFGMANDDAFQMWVVVTCSSAAIVAGIYATQWTTPGR